MINADTILTIAELAVGLIGVSGIVVVFMSRDGMNIVDRMRFILLLVNGMLVTVAAFVPFWLLPFVENSSELWQLSSITCLIVVVPIGIIVARYQANHAEWAEERRRMPFLLRYGVHVLGFIGLAIVLFNATNWPISANQTLYEIGMMSSMIQVSFFFIELAVYPVKSIDRVT